MNTTVFKRSIGKKLLWFISAALFAGLVIGCSGNGGESKRPNSVTDHIGKGRTFYRQGNYEKAVEMYEKAVILDPSNADAYLQLGIIYDDNIKDEERAVEYYRRYLRLDPDSDKAQRVREWLRESSQAEMPNRGEEGTTPGESRSLPPTPSPRPETPD